LGVDPVAFLPYDTTLQLNANQTWSLESRIRGYPPRFLSSGRYTYEGGILRLFDQLGYLCAEARVEWLSKNRIRTTLLRSLWTLAPPGSQDTWDRRSW